MSKVLRTTILTGALTLLITTEPTVAQQQSTGAKIGTIVTDALNAALPGVGALVKLFRPSDNPTNATTVQQVTAARKQLLTDAAAKLKPLSGMSGELAAVNQFLAASVPATNRCARFLGALDTTQPGDPETQLWKECQEQLKKIAAIQDTVLQAVTDDGIRLQLVTLQGLVRDADSEIQRSITAKNWPDVRGQVRALNQSLNAVLALSGIEVSRFKAATDQLVQWANNPAGSSAVAPANEAMFLKESQNALTTARGVIKASKR